MVEANAVSHHSRSRSYVGGWHPPNRSSHSSSIPAFINDDLYDPPTNPRGSSIVKDDLKRTAKYVLLGTVIGIVVYYVREPLKMLLVGIKDLVVFILRKLAEALGDLFRLMFGRKKDDPDEVDDESVTKLKPLRFPNMVGMLRRGVNRKAWRGVLNRIKGAKFEGDVDKVDASIGRLGFTWKALAGRKAQRVNIVTGESEPATGADIRELAASDDGFGLSDKDAERFRLMWLLHKVGGKIPPQPMWDGLSKWFTRINSLNAKGLKPYDGFLSDRMIVGTGNQIAFGPRRLTKLGMLAHLAGYWEQTKDNWVQRLHINLDAREAAKEYLDLVNEAFNHALEGVPAIAVNKLISAGAMFVLMDPAGFDDVDRMDWVALLTMHNLSLAAMCVEAANDTGSPVGKITMGHTGLMVLRDMKPMLGSSVVMHERTIVEAGHKTALDAVRSYADILEEDLRSFDADSGENGQSPGPGSHDVASSGSSVQQSALGNVLGISSLRMNFWRTAIRTA